MKEGAQVNDNGIDIGSFHMIGFGTNGTNMWRCM
jgi:hypothetical protein